MNCTGVPALLLSDVRSRVVEPLLATPIPGEVRAFELAAPRPNPAAGPVSVRLALSAPSHLRAEVIDVAGRVVSRIANARFAAGDHTLRWDGRGTGGRPAAAGLYFLRVKREGGESRVVRFTRLR